MKISDFQNLRKSLIFVRFKRCDSFFYDMGVQQYLRVNMSNSDVSKLVEDAFNRRQGSIEVSTLRRAMKEAFGRDPTGIARLDEHKRRVLTHCGPDNGIVYYTINRGMISATDYYSREK